ncbi:hypothetical protein CEUSTIGMA_g7317.t1 [Chlamydomonas eustigma]|uniref:Uncharacterized protein n=1 Tax=Chlamydomonas eustigma TaxID=1157962 RepID=A0A250X9Y4_9CHLO|nr:hypothetical protein CEUSTIGMA_g7317.t1 [Chlamydomonas eustigma]|eukprot:GAX79877.1 hypothetical protein CEUSTIGMA_g7317.t1 [Chlamydomonas eustigma]
MQKACKPLSYCCHSTMLIHPCRSWVLTSQTSATQARSSMVCSGGLRMAMTILSSRMLHSESLVAQQPHMLQRRLSFSIYLHEMVPHGTLISHGYNTATSSTLSLPRPNHVCEIY